MVIKHVIKVDNETYKQLGELDHMWGTVEADHCCKIRGAMIFRLENGDELAFVRDMERILEEYESKREGKS